MTRPSTRPTTERVRDPASTSSTDDCHVSPDGFTWTPVPQLMGLNGPVSALGDGIIALGACCPWS
jgi:hypothetical protein